MAGIGKAVLKMSFGEAPAGTDTHRDGILSYVPQYVFIAILLTMGVSLPPFMLELIQKAAALL